MPIAKTDAEWAAELTPEQFHVLRQHGTERPGASPLNAEKRDGRFLCAACRTAAFASAARMETGPGGPPVAGRRDGARERREERGEHVLHEPVPNDLRYRALRSNVRRCERMGEDGLREHAPHDRIRIAARPNDCGARED